MLGGARSRILRLALKRPWLSVGWRIEAVLAWLYCAPCFGTWALAGLAGVFVASGAMPLEDAFSWFAQTLFFVIFFREKFSLEGPVFEKELRDGAGIPSPEED
jgi:hypothetical protein